MRLLVRWGLGVRSKTFFFLFFWELILLQLDKQGYFFIWNSCIAHKAGSKRLKSYVSIFLIFLVSKLWQMWTERLYLPICSGCSYHNHYHYHYLHPHPPQPPPLRLHLQLLYSRLQLHNSDKYTASTYCHRQSFCWVWS